MLRIDSEIDGKRAFYGDIRDCFEKEGFTLGGNWGYDGGYIDRILSKEGGETVYLRIPVEVTQGELDSEKAQLQFASPLVVKHVVHVGIEEDENQDLLNNAAGMSALLNQFQTPVDNDGNLKGDEKWKGLAEEALSRVLPYIS